MTLLRIPREIRDSILEFVLIGNSSEPPVDATYVTESLRRQTPTTSTTPKDRNPRQSQTTTSSTKQNETTTTTRGYNCKTHHFLEKRCVMSGASGIAGSSSGDLPVFYQTTENPALALLLTNRQIHHEVQDMIARWRSVDYTTDVLFVNNVGLWTTWLSVPVRIPRIDTLYAKFRLFGAPQNLARGIYKPTMWSGGGGAAGATGGAGVNRRGTEGAGGRNTGSWSTSGSSSGAWGFYDLLNGLLEGNIGPWPQDRFPSDINNNKNTSSRDKSQNGGGLFIKRLVIDVTSTSETDILSLSEIAKWASTSQLPANFLASSTTTSTTSSEGGDGQAEEGDACLSNQKVAAITFARLVQFLLSMLQSPVHRGIYGENLFHRVGTVEVQVDGERFGDEVNLSQSLADFSWLRGKEGPSPFREELVSELLRWQRRAVTMRRQAGLV